MKVTLHIEADDSKFKSIPTQLVEFIEELQKQISRSVVTTNSAIPGLEITSHGATISQDAWDALSSGLRAEQTHEANEGPWNAASEPFQKIDAVKGHPLRPLDAEDREFVYKAFIHHVGGSEGSLFAAVEAILSKRHTESSP